MKNRGQTALGCALLVGVALAAGCTTGGTDASSADGGAADGASNDGATPGQCPAGRVWCPGCTPGSGSCSSGGCPGFACPPLDVPGYCPGYAPIAQTSERQCRLDSECADLREHSCLIEALVISCGGEAPVQECTADGECATGFFCASLPCGARQCEQKCPARACQSFEQCDGDGRCRDKPCNVAGARACPDGFACRADAGTCAPLVCPAGFTCAPGWDCNPTGAKADGHGCVHRSCVRDQDCACGTCFAGLCEPKPGFCRSTAQPP